MNIEKLKGIWEKIKAALKKVSKKVWIIIAAALVVVVAAIVIFLNSRPYAMLFTGLGSSDVSGILSCFNEWGVTDYQMKNGDTILVRSNVEDALRARLLEEGYPSQGFSWSPEYFDRVSALSTEAERNAARISDIESKMAATISCFDNVQSATVSINPGSDSSYILDRNKIQAASASVTVRMVEGKTLTAQQATAIRNMLAYGVEGMNMDPSVISINDTAGGVYDAASSESYDSDASLLKLVLEEQYANKIRAQLMPSLVALYGEDNVKLTVNCVVDLNYSTVDRYETIPPEWSDASTRGAGTIGSIIWNATLTMNEDGTVGGVVGTESNSDFSQYVEDLLRDNANLNQFTISGQTDMDNTHEETHTIRSTAYLADLGVGVIINSSTAGLVDTTEVRNFIAASTNIEPVVTEEMTADEYLNTKVYVMVQPFYEPPVDEPSQGTGNNFILPLWMVLAAAGGVVLFLILLIVILLISRKRKKKKLLQQQLEEEKTAALLESMGMAVGDAEEAEPAGADVMELHTERSMELRQDIRKFAEENPEIAAQLLKSWVRGDEDDG